MDSDDRDTEYQSVGDAHMIKMIPQEDTAIAMGTILSISLSDGKVLKSVFDFMKICPEIHLQCSEEGFSFIGVYKNKQDNVTEDQKDMVFYLTFLKNKIPEYFFCPANLNVEMPDGKDILTFKLSMNQITNMLKKTKMKATTCLRFELSGKTGVFDMFIIDTGCSIPYKLTFQIDRVIKNLVPDEITNPKISPSYKFSIELFYKLINAAASKSDNVAYDFRVAIHKGGIAAQTDAPGVGPIFYGTMRENPIIFNLSHDSTKYFSIIHKITPRSTINVTALDDKIFKISFPISSCGEGYIFQYPKKGFSMVNYSQPPPQQSQLTWNQHTSTPQITNYASPSHASPSTPYAHSQYASPHSSAPSTSYAHHSYGAAAHTAQGVQVIDPRQYSVYTPK